MHGSQNLVIWSGENMFFKMISNEGHVCMEVTIIFVCYCFLINFK